jgi:hypothetical protein
VSDTPRTDAEEFFPCESNYKVCEAGFTRHLERSLNAANDMIRRQQLLDKENLRLQDRIKRLEEAGDALEYASVILEAGEDSNGFEKLLIAQREWRKAKEAKP